MEFWILQPDALMCGVSHEPFFIFYIVVPPVVYISLLRLPHFSATVTSVNHIIYPLQEDKKVIE